MNAEPLPTPDSIQQLPDFLIEVALNLPRVQNLINQKTAQPAVTTVLMADFYVLLIMVIAMSILIQRSLAVRFDDDPNNNGLGASAVSPLYFGITYFIVRELLQMASLSSLGALSTCFGDPTKWLDMSAEVTPAAPSPSKPACRADRKRDEYLDCCVDRRGFRLTATVANVGTPSEDDACPLISWI